MKWDHLFFFPYICFHAKQGGGKYVNLEQINLFEKCLF